MQEELDTTEARQGRPRRMNMRVLFWGVPAAVLIMGALAIFWSQVA